MQNLSSSKANTISEAVTVLWPEYRRWAGVRNELERLARDPESRLRGIRDVVLWMLPDYLPDPRRRLADIDATVDQAAHDAFVAGYLGGLTRRALEADFPELPSAKDPHLTPHHWIKFHSGLITFVGKSGVATYRDRRLVWKVDHEYVRYFGHGVFFDSVSCEYIIDGIRYPSEISHSMQYVLPSGLVLQYSSGDGDARLTNVLTRQFCIIQISPPGFRGDAREIWDDYGVGWELHDRHVPCCGVALGYGRITY